MNVCSDVLFYIVQYCTVDTILVMSLVCKEYRSFLVQEKVWKMIGKRDCPVLPVSCYKDYLRNPEYIPERSLQAYLRKDNFSRTWLIKVYINKNGVQDHTIPALIRSIALCDIKIDKYRKLCRYVQDTFWRIAIMLYIEDLKEEGGQDYERLLENEKNFKILQE